MKDQQTKRSRLGLLSWAWQYSGVESVVARRHHYACRCNRCVRQRNARRRRAAEQYAREGNPLPSGAEWYEVEADRPVRYEGDPPPISDEPLTSPDPPRELTAWEWLEGLVTGEDPGSQQHPDDTDEHSDWVAALFDELAAEAEQSEEDSGTEPPLSAAPTPAEAEPSEGDPGTEPPLSAALTPAEAEHSEGNPSTEPPLSAAPTPAEAEPSEGDPGTEPPLSAALTPAEAERSEGNPGTEPPLSAALTPAEAEHSEGNPGTEPPLSAAPTPAEAEHSEGNPGTEPPLSAAPTPAEADQGEEEPGAEPRPSPAPTQVEVRKGRRLRRPLLIAAIIVGALVLATGGAILALALVASPNRASRQQVTAPTPDVGATVEAVVAMAVAQAMTTPAVPPEEREDETPVPPAAEPAAATGSLPEIDCGLHCPDEANLNLGHVEWLRKPEVTSHGVLSFLAAIDHKAGFKQAGSGQCDYPNISLTDDTNGLYGFIVSTSMAFECGLRPGQWRSRQFAYQTSKLSVSAQIDPAAATHPRLSVCLWTSGNNDAENRLLDCTPVRQPSEASPTGAAVPQPNAASPPTTSPSQPAAGQQATPTIDWFASAGWRDLAATPTLLPRPTATPVLGSAFHHPGRCWSEGVPFKEVHDGDGNFYALVPYEWIRLEGLPQMWHCAVLKSDATPGMVRGSAPGPGWSENGEGKGFYTPFGKALFVSSDIVTHKHWVLENAQWYPE